MLSLLPSLFLVVAPGQPGQPPPAFAEDDRLAGRHGAVILEKSTDDQSPHWRIRFKDRTLLEHESDELGLWELFEGEDGFDYVIVKHSTGGIACPAQFRVVEISPKGAPSVSEEFGSCVDPTRTRLYGNALVLDMPSYVPHPELLAAAEQRRRERTVEIYTVTHGKIAKREDQRR